MNRFIFWGIFYALCTSFTGEIEACTGIKLIARDGALVHGRTLEFGVPVDITTAVIPRDYTFHSTTPSGPGLLYKSKYAAVGASAFGDPALMDGLNEKGLAVGTFYFPTFAGYAQMTPENRTKALSPVGFANWILTQFASVAEVKTALSQVVIVPTIGKGWGPAPPPFHYIVFDKMGECLVIEPLDGKLVTYENKLGVFTNSPNFQWHMTNLRNFINMSPFNMKPITWNGVKLESFGQGSGMVGIPGDFTPPSRFVRAAIFSVTAFPADNANDAIFQLFHILNQFDIPLGVAREKVGDMIYSDKTQLTCARDPQALKYYFKSYDDQTIKVIDLKHFDLNAKTIKSLNITGAGKAYDISSQLK
jgi:choloylglycine hydrolase